MMLFGAIITLAYLILIGSLIYGYDKIELFIPKSKIPKTKFSVIIPFRNEASHLPALLKSIEELNYPSDLFEVVLVDDASTDNSVNLVESFIGQSKKHVSWLPNVRLTASPKKDAILTGIKSSLNPWIVTTDADCILPKYWLDSFDQFIQQSDALCIAAPVTYFNDNKLLNSFQTLDILSLQGATIGGFGIKKPFLCNGANFAYQKTLFKELQGFDGNSQIASGDDIFFLEKAIRYNPNKVTYLKSNLAVVKTHSEPTLKKILSQRIRWASKTKASNSNMSKLTGTIVLLMNFFVILSFLNCFIDFSGYKLFINVFIIKLITDFLLLYKLAAFFGQKNTLSIYPAASLIYPFFNIYVGILSLYSGYKWKDRVFKG
ncbi:glycosyltransferase [Cognatitamlana onchidii]|uniref:glycosyltransferase n=1 Tax=Cognatitamlana onchidii TaxID=2562860 RepID=UPI0010A61AF3|nr:glycosyltransferase [Algibacter onchidii]